MKHGCVEGPCFFVIVCLYLAFEISYHPLKFEILVLERVAL